MTEKEYIEFLRKEVHMTEKQIQDDINECKSIAEGNGVSVEEVYDDLASLYKTVASLKVGFTIYDNEDFLKEPPKDFKNPKGKDTDGEGE